MKKIILLSAAALFVFGFAAQINVVAQKKKTPASKKAATVKYQTFGSYFEKNNSGLEGDASYLIFTSQNEFDKIFGSAATMGENQFLPDNAFDSKLVIATIKRGNMSRKYKVKRVTSENGKLSIWYDTKDEAAPNTIFASPLILAVDKGDYNEIVFMENGKKARSFQVRELPLKTT